MALRVDDMNRESCDASRPPSTLDALLERNRTFADSYVGGRPTTEPTLRTVVLGCADHRADPAHILRLAPNEAVVIRNPGGRVTRSFLNELAVLAVVAMVEGLNPGFELIIVHHTDCGTARLAGPQHAALVETMFGGVGLSKPQLVDPRRTIIDDLDTLAATPWIPRTLIVGGIVYDVDTGRAQTVVEPAPLAQRAGP